MEQTGEILPQTYIGAIVPGTGDTCTIITPTSPCKLNGVLVYFAAHKNHLGFYPTGSTMKVFQEDFAAYKTSKGAVQFPFDKPLPLDLIDKIVRFRVNENMTKATR